MISSDPLMSTGFCHFFLGDSKSSSCSSEDTAGLGAWKSDPHELASSRSQDNPEALVLSQPCQESCSGAGTQKPQRHIWGSLWAQAPQVTHPNYLLLNHLLLLIVFRVLMLDWVICIFLGAFKDRYYLTLLLSFGTSLSSQWESVAGQKQIAYSLTTMH